MPLKSASDLGDGVGISRRDQIKNQPLLQMVYESKDWLSQIYI